MSKSHVDGETMGKKAAFALVALFIASLVLLGTPAAKAQMPPFSAQLPPSVHILAEGSVDPPNASVSRAGDVYTLTGDVGLNITVDKDNITIDGAGHTLWGNFSGGVHMDERLGVTVKNLVIKEAGYAFSMYKAADNTFVGNTLANCSKGFYFWISWRNNITGNTLMNVGTAFDFVDSSQHNIITANTIQNCGTAIDLSQPNNVFSDNTVTGSFDLGVSLSADFNVLRNNTISNNRVNFEVSSFNNDVDQSNTIDGKPVVYWVGHHDETVPSNAGYVVLVNSNNIQVHNLDVESIAIVSTVNSLITGNKITGSNNSIQPVKSEDVRFPVPQISLGYGIQLIGSSNDVVSGNFVSGKDYGVKLTDSTGIKVLGNNITGNTYYGMMLKNSDNNIIEGNSIVSNGFVTGVFTQGDAFGVSISGSSFNRFVGNYVKANNFWGIRVLSTQQGNVIYHNNFIDNQVRDGGLQVSMMGPANPSIWDNGMEGNYWSDYRTRYLNASEVGGSGVGDTPFFINVNNQDNHPLMAPYDISVYAQQSPSPSPSANPSTSPTSSPSQSPTTSATPQTSESPTASPSPLASEQPATSSGPKTTTMVPIEYLFAAVSAVVAIAVLAAFVFARRHRSKK